MRKKLGSFAAMLALVTVSLIHTGTAHATCWFGDPSAVVHGTQVISSSVFGGTFVLFGQNQGTFNGGYPVAAAQRWDSSSVTTGVHGAAYTSQVAANGSTISVTSPFTNLQNQAIHYVFPNGGYMIGNLQVQVWFCQ